MGDRRLVKNSAGLTVAVDVGRDMDERTFDQMVERGDLVPVKDEKPKADKSKSKK